jgi:two-component system phosphate regulon sensor histidine kinase PhoR
MPSFRNKAPSLYQQMQDSEATPEYIQVKPKGFKAILQSMVEFLESHQIAATVLVKLPAGSAWTDDIYRYGQSLAPPHQLFCFARPDASPSAGLANPGVTVPILGAETWLGDYFVVIHRPDFAALVVAHRIQSLSATRDFDDDEEGETSGQRSTYLSVACSMNPILVAAVLSALQQEDQFAAIDWSSYDVSGEANTSPDFLAMADKWLNWQIRLQERLRQAASSYRRQAMSMSSLSSQNEVLLNTLRLKDDFLNTVGQELRTPLTTIKTALTLLDAPQLKPPQRQRYMEMISHECDRQSALISGVLNLLQMETSVGLSPPTPLCLADTVPPLVSTYQPLAQEKGIMLAYTIPNHLPNVSCPSPWLRQIIIHLLNNSLKYTGNNGKVWVTAHAGDDFVEVEVRDTGTGITPGDLPHIFEHFYRGRNLPADETEGAGLGLSIVQQLLMYCGGTIVVNSQVGSGTSFVVRLPIAEA